MDFEFSLNETVPGQCALSGEPLGILGDVTRVPIFEAPLHDSRDLQWLAGAAVRFDRWHKFKHQNDIVNWAIDAVACEFEDAPVIVRSDHVFAAISHIPEIDRFNGILAMPRSAKFFRNIMGDDVKSAELRLTGDALKDLLRFLQTEAWRDGLIIDKRRIETPNVQIVASPHDTISSWLFLNADEAILLRVLGADVAELQAAIATANS